MGFFDSLAPIVGGVGGFFVGGPAGAAAGFQLGKSLTEDEAEPSGAFAGTAELGDEFGAFLQRRLREDPSQSESFRLGSEAIRERTGAIAAAQRQRLGNAASTGGFLDSGSVQRGLSDIDRAELQAFSGSTRDLLLGLIDRQTEGVLPFLSGGSSENINIRGLNNQRRGQSLDFLGPLIQAQLG